VVAHAQGFIHAIQNIGRIEMLCSGVCVGQTVQQVVYVQDYLFAHAPGFCYQGEYIIPVWALKHQHISGKHVVPFYVLGILYR
jgi:hypothetical protein